jgi:thiaminase/transcriptional activator TenA
MHHNTSDNSTMPILKLSQQFWDASQSIISSTEKHPFLTSMVEGSLSLDKFTYYVLQDAIYLTDFSFCLSRLSEKAPNEAHRKRLKEMAIGADECEKELHRSFFKTFNIDDQNVQPMPNTVLYTSYMIRVVETRPYEEGLAVLLPCFWVYMHVGKEMLKLREALGDSVKRGAQFDAWIDMYASEEFEKEVTDYIDMVDDVQEGDEFQCDQTTIDNMQKHFVMCCKLEHMFWDQAEGLMDWPAL